MPQTRAQRLKILAAGRAKLAKMRASGRAKRGKNKSKSTASLIAQLKTRGSDFARTSCPTWLFVLFFVWHVRRVYSGPTLHFLRGLFALVPSVVLANGTYTCIVRQLDSEVLHVRRARLQVRAVRLKAALFVGKGAKLVLRRLYVFVLVTYTHLTLPTI